MTLDKQQLNVALPVMFQTHLRKLQTNVCMIVYNFFVNDARVIREAKTLVKNGYEVTVFALHKEGLRQSEEMHGFGVNRIHLTFGKFPQYNIFQILKYFEFTLRCYLRTRKEDISVCHCHDLEALLVGYLIMKFHRCKLIYDSHELWGDPQYIFFTRLSYPKFVFYIQRKLEHFMMRRAHAIITVSDSIGEFIAKENKVRKPYLIRNVPNLAKVKKSSKIREKIGLIDDKRKIILYQGGLRRGRGLENLIVSMRSVDHAVLVMLGDGVIKEKLKDLAVKHRVEKKIFFISAVSPEEVFPYTCSADIGVHPIENICLNHYYCLPNKLFEYLMAGLPVAVSEFPEMAGIVKEYKVGEVFDPAKPHDIARAINSLLHDQDEYRKCKLNIKRVNQTYNWENEEKKLLGIYQDLLGQ